MILIATTATVLDLSSTFLLVLLLIVLYSSAATTAAAVGAFSKQQSRLLYSPARRVNRIIFT